MNEQEQKAFNDYMNNIDNELQKFDERVSNLTQTTRQELAEHIKLIGTYKDYNEYVITLMRKNKDKDDNFDIPLSEQEWLQQHKK